jgi:5-methylcytosine-specific restriction enzyme subunit McrC
MLTYRTALDVPKAWLVYAGSGEARKRRISNSVVSVTEFPIDISQQPEALLERVQNLEDQAFGEFLQRRGTPVFKEKQQGQYGAT